jgi:hypothetical protein
VSWTGGNKKRCALVSRYELSLAHAAHARDTAALGSDGKGAGEDEEEGGRRDSADSDDALELSKRAASGGRDGGDAEMKEGDPDDVDDAAPPLPTRTPLRRPQFQIEVIDDAAGDGQPALGELASDTCWFFTCLSSARCHVYSGQCHVYSGQPVKANVPSSLQARCCLGQGPGALAVTTRELAGEPDDIQVVLSCAGPGELSWDLDREEHREDEEGGGGVPIVV